MTQLGRMCRMMALAMVCLMAGCAGGAPDFPQAAAAPSDDYHLDAGDEVRVTAYGLDALNNSYDVGDAGNIALPLVGNVQARGKTAGQLQDEIARLLIDRKIILQPSVTVQITRYRPFYILGEVAKPGEYPYRPGMTVLTAISAAGGYTYRASKDGTTVTRQVDGRALTGRVNPDMRIQPGDTITVKEGWF